MRAVTTRATMATAPPRSARCPWLWSTLSSSKYRLDPLTEHPSISTAKARLGCADAPSARRSEVRPSGTIPWLTASDWPMEWEASLRPCRGNRAPYYDPVRDVCVTMERRHLRRGLKSSAITMFKTVSLPIWLQNAGHARAAAHSPRGPDAQGWHAPWFQDPHSVDHGRKIFPGGDFSRSYSVVGPAKSAAGSI